MITISGLKKATAVAALALVLSGQAEARARKQVQPFMPMGQAADAPWGFVDMCGRDRALCMIGATPQATLVSADVEPQFINMPTALKGGTGVVANAAYVPPPVFATLPTATPAIVVQAAPAREVNETALRQMVRQVNSQVNRSTVRVADQGEFWRRAQVGDESMGDCEDIAIEKRIRLSEAGFPAERMFYAVAYVPIYGLHTVLVARLDDGDYVLDSMTPHLRRWGQVHYVWLRRQVGGEPLLWTRMDGPPAITTMASAASATNPAPVS